MDVPGFPDISHLAPPKARTGSAEHAPASAHQDGLRWMCGLRNILAGYDRWDGNFGLFAAYENDRGAFIGWFLLRPEEEGPLDEVELGYRLRQEQWGKGYATEGSRALLAKGFTDLGVRLVWAATMTLNDGSRKVMEKVGMTMTGTLETPPDMQMVEGSELGGVRYEITKEQWAQH
jgi:RimJ/RimL family protein N-acetyltransferase